MVDLVNMGIVYLVYYGMICSSLTLLLSVLLDIFTSKQKRRRLWDRVSSVFKSRKG